MACEARSSASCWRARGTIIRVHAEQVCRELSMALRAPAGMAFSKGASSSTTKADFPPNSRGTFLIVSAASAPILRPARKESVKLIRSTGDVKQ